MATHLPTTRELRDARREGRDLDYMATKAVQLELDQLLNPQRATGILIQGLIARIERLEARVAEVVDAGVSNTLSERSAGSSPAPGTTSGHHW